MWDSSSVKSVVIQAGVASNSEGHGHNNMLEKPYSITCRVTNVEMQCEWTVSATYPVK